MKRMTMPVWEWKVREYMQEIIIAALVLAMFTGPIIHWVRR